MTRGDEDEMEQEANRAFEAFCRWLAKRHDLPNALRALRAKRELSLREAALHAYCTAPYIYRVERGLRTPERDMLIVLCLHVYDLDVRQTDRMLLLAGYAPLHHERRAFTPPRSRLGRIQADDMPSKTPRDEH